MNLGTELSGIWNKFLAQEIGLVRFLFCILVKQQEGQRGYSWSKVIKGKYVKRPRARLQMAYTSQGGI